MSWVTPEQFAAQVILEVCELPDYTSPDDQPDLLQCTVKQLENCVLRAFEHFDQSSGNVAAPETGGSPGMHPNCTDPCKICDAEKGQS